MGEIHGSRTMVYAGEQWRRKPGRGDQVLVDVEDVAFVYDLGPRVVYRRVGARSSSPRLLLSTFLLRFQPASEAGGPQVSARERWQREFEQALGPPAEKS